MTTRTTTRLGALAAILLLVVGLLTACGDDDTGAADDAASTETADPTEAAEPTPAGEGEAEAEEPADGGDAATGEDGATDAGDGDTGEATGDTGGYPVTLDNCGFELTFEEQPERVLILNGSGYSESTTFAALGLEDTVLANAQFPLGYSDAEGIAETVAAMPNGGLEIDPTLFEVQREAILAARPDLVVSIWSGGFSEFGSNITREELQELGIDTYVSRPYCDYGSVSQAPPVIGLDASWELIEDLGIIFQVEDRATALIEEQQTTLEAVASAVEGAEPVTVAMLNPSALWASFSANGVAGIGTFPVQNAIIEAAGGVNAFTDSQASLEQMVSTDVDVIVITMTDPTTTPEDMAQLVFDAFPEWDATKNQAWTFISDGSYFGPTQHIAVEKIAAVAHPDLVAG